MPCGLHRALSAEHRMLPGAAGSALLTFEGDVPGGDIFRQLLCWRILLGIGAGGVRVGVGSGVVVVVSKT